MYLVVGAGTGGRRKYNPPLYGKNISLPCKVKKYQPPYAFRRKGADSLSNVVVVVAG